MELSTKLFSLIIARAKLEPNSRSTNEMRRADRVAMRMKVRITPSTGPRPPEAKPPKPGWSMIRNLSLRGVSLEHPTPMPHGAQFLMHLHGDIGRPAIHLLCSVVHCSKEPEKGHCVIGAEFTCIQEPDAKPAKADPRQLARIRQSILD